MNLVHSDCLDGRLNGNEWITIWNSISIVRPKWIDKIGILAHVSCSRYIEYLVHTIHRHKLYIYMYDRNKSFAFLPYHSLLINGIYIIFHEYPPFRELLTFIFRFRFALLFRLIQCNTILHIRDSLIFRTHSQTHIRGLCNWPCVVCSIKQTIEYFWWHDSKLEFQQCLWHA